MRSKGVGIPRNPRRLEQEGEWSQKLASLLQMSQGNSEFEESIVRLSRLRKPEVSLLEVGVTDMRIKRLLLAALDEFLLSETEVKLCPPAWGH